jgi:hypothetical protein
MPGNAAVLAAVAVELLGRLFRVLLTHHASNGFVRRTLAWCVRSNGWPWIRTTQSPEPASS